MMTKGVTQLSGFACVLLLATTDCHTHTRAQSGPQAPVRRFHIETPADKLPSPIVQLLFLNDGRQLAARTSNHQVYLWDAVTGKLINKLQFEPLKIGTYVVEPKLSISPQGKVLHMRGLRELPLLYDLATGKEEAEWDEHVGIRPETTFSPDGKLVAAGLNPAIGSEQTSRIVLLEATSGKQIADFGTVQGMTRRLLFSPSGKSVVAIAGAPILFRIADKDRIANPLPGPIADCVCWLGDNQLVVSFVETVRQVGILDTESGDHLAQFACPPDVANSSYSASGLQTAMAIDMTNGRVAVPVDGEKGVAVQIRAVPSGRLLASLPQQNEFIHSLEFTPDGKYLAVGTEKGTVALWDVDKALAEFRKSIVALQPQQVQELWAGLGSTDRIIAARAIDRLVQDSPRALSILKERLQPVSDDGLEKLIQDLDSPNYRTRQRAMQQLLGREQVAKAALEKALQGDVPLEVHLRAKRLLSQLENLEQRPDVIRPWRALAVLEQIGTPEAKALLIHLTKGSPLAELTRRAQQTLQRIERWHRRVRASQ